MPIKTQPNNILVRGVLTAGPTSCLPSCMDTHGSVRRAPRSSPLYSDVKYDSRREGMTHNCVPRSSCPTTTAGTFRTRIVGACMHRCCRMRSHRFPNSLRSAMVASLPSFRPRAPRPPSRFHALTHLTELPSGTRNRTTLLFRPNARPPGSWVWELAIWCAFDRAARACILLPAASALSAPGGNLAST